LAYTIPSDSHVIGDTGHTTDHNNLADVASLALGINVKNTAYAGGARGDGSTDDSAAIQAALNACPSGGFVYLPPAVYRIGTQLTVPPFVSLVGTHGNRTDNTQLSATIKPLGSFTGTAALRFVDKEEGPYSADNNGIRVVNLTLDGSAVSGTVDGIRATGLVHGVVLDRVAIQSFPRRGISCETYTRADLSVQHPYSWNLWFCMAWQTASEGYYFGNVQTDCTFLNCEALGCGLDGFYFVACQSSQVTSCRAEFCQNGFRITGSWGTGTGSGGLIMNGCSTDRNTQNGILIDSTGSAGHQISGMHCRRDGRNANSGGGGYAGLAVSSCTNPVIVNGMVCYPGVDDDGSGTNSPQYGATFSGSTWVSVSNSYLHGNTGGWNDGGSNTLLRRGPNAGTASGSTASPTRDTSNPWNTTGQGTIALAASDAIALALSNTSGNTGASLVDVTGSANTSRMLNGQVSGDSTRRYNLRVDGLMEWGPGSGARDCTLDRQGANMLEILTADLDIATAGRGLRVKEGSNAKMGTSALTAGAATVSNTSVTANSRILLTSNADGGTPGWLRVSARSAGTSFTITSSSGTDTSTVAWLILEPG